MFGFRLPNYNTPGDVGPISGGRPNGVEEDIKILKEGSDEESVVEGEDEGESEEESPESDKEDSDDGEETAEESDDDNDEDSEEEPEEETEETDEIKITVKGIKKDFPEFFKKHPEMKGVIFREKQYSEIYSNPQEAQQAARQANQFISMERDLLSGDTEPLFKALKQANGGKSYESFVSNLLPNLLKVDKDTYYKVVEVPLKRALRAAFKDGERSNNGNLKNSAAWLNNYLFPDSDINAKVEFETAAKPTEKTKEQQEYENKINELNKRDHYNYKQSVDNEFYDKASKFFFDGLDPDNILSEKTKEWMLKDMFEELDAQLVKDTRHMRGIESLWGQAAGSGYNPSFKTRIVNTSLARAKQIIPSIRQKLRAEALGERRKITKGKEQNDSKSVVKRISSGNNSNGNKKLDKKSMRGMSDLDIIRS